MQDYLLVQDKKFLIILKVKYFRQKNPKRAPEPEPLLEPEPTVFATPTPTKNKLRNLSFMKIFFDESGHDETYVDNEIFNEYFILNIKIQHFY